MLASTPLSLTSLAVTGADSADFKLTSHCPASLGAGLHCNLSVAFDPIVSGTLTAAVTGAGTATLALTGVATQVKLSPTTLAFGSVTVGQPSAPQTVTLTNVGSNGAELHRKRQNRGRGSSRFLGDDHLRRQCGRGAELHYHGDIQAYV